MGTNKPNTVWVATCGHLVICASTLTLIAAEIGVSYNTIKVKAKDNHMMVDVKNEDGGTDWWRIVKCEVLKVKKNEKN